MRVIETRDCPPAGSWEDALRKLRESEMLPRQPGHETHEELQKRLHISSDTLRSLFKSLGDGLEVGEMDQTSKSGRRVRLQTYCIKPLSASRRRQ